MVFRVGCWRKVDCKRFMLAFVLVGGLTWFNGYMSAKQIEEREIADLSAQSKTLGNMMLVFYKNLLAESDNYRKMLASNYPGNFQLEDKTSLVAGKNTPTLKNAGNTINNDTVIPDKFTQMTGALATVFVKDKDNFVRVSTSLKKENGERAVGTNLDPAHPAYKPLMEGKPFGGLAFLFGKQYVTKYEPIKNADGNTIGVLFVGVDVSNSLGSIKDTIKAIKIGQTGYLFALDANPGKDFGKLALHPNKEGVNILDAKDASGQEFIKDMLAKKTGILYYPWQNKEGSGTQDYVAAFTLVPELNWVVAGSVPLEEVTHEAIKLRNLLMLCALVALLALAALLFLLIRRSVTLPLRLAASVSGKLAQGDFTETIQTQRADEIGALMRALNEVSTGLTGLVRRVRTGAEVIATASSQIAAGN